MYGRDKWRDKAKEYRQYARWFAENGMVGAAHDARKDAAYCQRKAASELARVGHALFEYEREVTV